LHVSDQRPGELSNLLLSLRASWHSAQRRFNARRKEGCGYYQTTTLNKRRWSAAKAYLSHAPANLTIATNAHATRV